MENCADQAFFPLPVGPVNRTSRVRGDFNASPDCVKATSALRSRAELIRYKTAPEIRGSELKVSAPPLVVSQFESLESLAFERAGQSEASNVVRLLAGQNPFLALSRSWINTPHSPFILS